MSLSRAPKKTGTIEVRVADELKAAFAERCRQDQVTVSEAVRGLIQTRLAASSSGPSTGPARARLFAAGLIGAALGIGAAAPSFAHATDRSAFERLDRNHDRVLTFDEYHQQGRLFR